MHIIENFSMREFNFRGTRKKWQNSEGPENDYKMTQSSTNKTLIPFRTMQHIKSINKMPLLEFITANLKSDATSQKVFRSQWPIWRRPLVDAPGASQVHYGYMISENDINVEAEMKLVMSLSTVAFDLLYYCV